MDYMVLETRGDDALLAFCDGRALRFSVARNFDEDTGECDFFVEHLDLAEALADLRRGPGGRAAPTA